MLIRTALFALALTASSATGRVATAQTPGASAPALAQAWQRVTLARSAAQQAHEVGGFLRAAASAGHRQSEMVVDARDIASGRAVPADDPALLQRPQAHEVTVALDARFYVFRPLSRASVEPLLRR